MSDSLIDPKRLLRPTLKRMSKLQQIGFDSNLKFRDGAMRLRALEAEAVAKAKGQRFRCKALSGESSYNIAINADLSVSCNCDDTRGEGRIGSLKERTFEEVFRGKEANALRRALADGKLPITPCIQCPELERVPAAEAERWVEEYELPKKGVMLENNANCNLSCVGCYRAHRPLENLKMGINDLRRVVKELADIGVEQFSFFTLGEPFMSKNILEEMKVIREVHPNVVISTSTNGVLLDNDSKREAALKMDVVCFSVDGSDQESLVKYQVGSDFEAAYRNMCDLVEMRDRVNGSTIIRWKYIVFRWNDDRYHIERAIELAKKAKVDTLEFWFTLNPFYAISHRFFTASYFRDLAPVDDARRRMLVLRERGEKLRSAEASFKLFRAESSDPIVQNSLPLPDSEFDSKD